MLKLFQILMKIFIKGYSNADGANSKEIIFECIGSCLISLFNIAQLALSLQKKLHTKYKDLGIIEDLF